MRNNGWAKVGYVLAEGDPNAIYFREVLEHYGVRAERFESIEDALGSDVVLLCGDGETSMTEATHLETWVHQGGLLLACGAAWGLEDLFGLAGTPQHVSNGLLKPVSSALWPEHAAPIRFFGGKFHAHLSGAQSLLTTACGRHAATSCSRGEGGAWTFAPHLGQTFKLMQLGRSVECDAIGPTDGSAVLDDGVLRSEDGINLSFEHDRTQVEGDPSPFFAHPHCDALKELFVRLLFEVIESRNLRTLGLWQWPNHASGAAMVTFDCEEFEFDHVSRMQRMLTMFGSRTTWLVAMPGYPADAYRQMRTWGYEVGLLYDADDTSGWHPEKLHIQFTAIGRLSSVSNIVSVRPIGGRWRGYTQFYESAQEAGARVSLSKGGRQPGTQGFAFGTCHPFHPARKDGLHLTLEIPYVIFDPGQVTSDTVSDCILVQTALRHGCFHLVSKPSAVLDPACHSALRRTLSLCKQHRLEFMTPEEVYQHERARRQARISIKTLGSETVVQLTSDVEVDGLSLLISGPKVEAESKGRDLTVTPVTRYGRTFNAITVRLEAKQMLEISLKNASETLRAA